MLQPEVSLSIFHTRLRIDVDSHGLLLLSEAANLNDNQWHTATLTFLPSSDNLTVAELMVDGVVDSSVAAELSIPALAVGDPLYAGGIANQLSVVVAEGFRGCIGEIFIDSRYICIPFIFHEQWKEDHNHFLLLVDF